VHSHHYHPSQKSSQIRRLQAVQNAADRLVSGARRRDYVSPILRSLHWLPVRRRVIFKSAIIAWKCVVSQWRMSVVAPDCGLRQFVAFYCLGFRPLLDSPASRTAVLQCGTVCPQPCAKTCHWLHLRQN